MTDISINQIQPALSSAASVTVAAFAFRLAGRIFADSKPFHDNREWAGDLLGPVFAMSLLSMPVLLAMRLIGWVTFLSWGGFRAATITFVQALLIIILESYSELKNGRRSKSLDFVRKMNSIDERHWLVAAKKYEPLARLLILPLLMCAVLVASTYELIHGSAAWAAYDAAQVFISFVFVVMAYAASQSGAGKVNIYFSNGEQPWLDALLLKVNEDNIRAIHGGSAHIVNKSIIARIEVAIDPATRVEVPEEAQK